MSCAACVPPSWKQAPASPRKGGARWLRAGGAHGGSVGGRHGGSDANKAFNVLSSLGNIAFAYTFALVRRLAGQALVSRWAIRCSAE